MGPNVSKKKPAIAEFWKQRERNLKAVGFGDEIKGPWTEAKKRKVRKLTEEWGAIGANVKDFQKVSTKKLTPSALKDLQAFGYKVKDDTAYIPKQGYKSVTLAVEYRKDKKTGEYERVMIVRRRQTGIDPNDQEIVRKKQEEFIGSQSKQLEWAERLAEEFRQGKFKDGERLYLKVYDNSPMPGSQAFSLKALYAYAERIKWNLQEGRSKTELMNNLHIVKIWASKDNFAAFEKSSSTARAEKRRRSKNLQKAKVPRKNSKTKGRGPK